MTTISPPNLCLLRERLESACIKPLSRNDGVIIFSDKRWAFFSSVAAHVFNEATEHCKLDDLKPQERLAGIAILEKLTALQYLIEDSKSYANITKEPENPEYNTSWFNKNKWVIRNLFLAYTKTTFPLAFGPFKKKHIVLLDSADIDLNGKHRILATEEKLRTLRVTA